MPDSLEERPSGLSCPENLAQVRQLLRPRFSHDLHDYALEGICKAADGLHVVSVVKTGGGKTTFFTGFIALLQELSKLPANHALKTCLVRTFPDHPLSIIVYPTKGLEVEMEQTFNSLAIKSLAINEDTLAAARRQHENLWHTATNSSLSCLILSPEQLTSRHFHIFLLDKSVFARIVCLGVDEIHLILSWGLPQFRSSFRDIGNALMRLPARTTLIGVTATLAAGNPTQKLVDILGLRPGTFFFSCRSNRRPELQLIFRVLRHGLQGWDFPDLKWVIEGNRKTIIYCRTISLAFRLFDHVRFCCALFSTSYNTDSRNMFINNSVTQVLITTDALKVGNDFPNINDAICINPETPEDVLQYGGRAGRREIRSGPGPRAISYFTQSTVDRAKAVLAGKEDVNWDLLPENPDERQGKMSIRMARLVLAACIETELDIQFDNPAIDGCKPEEPLPSLPKNMSSHRAGGGVPMAERISDKFREYSERRLEKFRYKVWSESTDVFIESLPPTAVLPDTAIKSVLDNFSNILKRKIELAPFVGEFIPIMGKVGALMDELSAVEKELKDMSIGVNLDKRTGTSRCER
ncbi:hypothetical protein K435DRAFT_766589 [Dendrothele bispora CBS 962.96]|uniref:DNA 3'-5' helicase n=1 Tax=Dendrothele bispora (strain CBS 962.96) TaxID=1314807 RepID=A0A4S8L342_DENBC|nr:hypothetical protein K435DRAFT_766589 [Dendrothele bispora CBS 962.96]